MGRYIDDARSFYQEAMREFHRGKREGNTTVIRDAAEKAWNAIVQATNELIDKRGMPPASTHAERRDRLIELTRLDPEVRELGIRDRFSARARHLHEECFYEGSCPVDLLEEEITEKVKAYIDDVERL